MEVSLIIRKILESDLSLEDKNLVIRRIIELSCNINTQIDAHLITSNDDYLEYEFYIIGLLVEDEFGDRIHTIDLYVAEPDGYNSAINAGLNIEELIHIILKDCNNKREKFNKNRLI